MFKVNNKDTRTTLLTLLLMMMMIMNFFCGMVDRRKAFSLISSRTIVRDPHHRESPTWRDIPQESFLESFHKIRKGSATICGFIMSLLKTSPMMGVSSKFLIFSKKKTSQR